MLPTPRIVVIDDNPEHLTGLVTSLARQGTACMPVLFAGDPQVVKSCRYLRILFADLHLNEGGAGADHEQHFALIGGLLEENVRPVGPYVIILWTRFADQAAALKKFLDDRLQGIPQPFAVVPLDKNQLLAVDGKVQDADKLADAISDALNRQKQIAALFNWEERILGAAAETVSAIARIGGGGGDEKTRTDRLDKVLCRLGVEAVGESNLEPNRFEAVNEALLPILADRIGALTRTAESAELWQTAFSPDHINAEFSLADAAELNFFMHFAVAGDISPLARGSVIQFAENTCRGTFEETFMLSMETAAKEHFACSNYSGNNQNFRWLLVQVEAVCDYAQNSPGPLPFALGLEMPCASKAKDTPPAGLWLSPPFKQEEQQKFLFVHSRFQLTVTEGRLQGVRPVYRLREALINDLVFRIHFHGARPGIVSFRERKARPPKTPIVKAIEKPTT